MSDNEPTRRDARDDRPSAKTSLGMDPTVAGALSYLLGPFTGILIYVSEDRNEFARFHAAQSVVVFGWLFVLGILLSIVLAVLAVVIPPIGFLLGIGSFLLVPVGIGFWLFLMYRAYCGEEYEVPIAGRYARRYAPPTS